MLDAVNLPVGRTLKRGIKLKSNISTTDVISVHCRIVLCFQVVLITAGIGVFAGFEYKEAGVSLFTVGGKGQFAWGCYVAVAGVVAALLAAVLFFCDGCRGSGATYYDSYETTRMI